MCDFVCSSKPYRLQTNGCRIFLPSFAGYELNISRFTPFHPLFFFFSPLLSKIGGGGKFCSSPLLAYAFDCVYIYKVKYSLMIITKRNLFHYLPGGKLFPILSQIIRTFSHKNFNNHKSNICILVDYKYIYFIFITIITNICFDW